MPLVCLFFAIWYGKSKEIKALQKESANLFILYFGNNPSREKKKMKKKLSGKELQIKELKNRFHNAQIKNKNSIVFLIVRNSVRFSYP